MHKESLKQCLNVSSWHRPGVSVACAECPKLPRKPATRSVDAIERLLSLSSSGRGDKPALCDFDPFSHRSTIGQLEANLRSRVRQYNKREHYGDTNSNSDGLPDNL